MSLLEQIDQARARALVRYQRETGAAVAQATVAAVAPPKIQPAPAIVRLLRLPLLLFFAGLPVFALLGLAGVNIETPFYLFGKSMLLLSTIGLLITILAAFGRLPARWARDWRPGRVGLVPRILLLALLWASLFFEMPWLVFLTPLFLIRPIMRMANAGSLRAMEERELLRLRAGLPPTPPIAGTHQEQPGA